MLHYHLFTGFSLLGLVLGRPGTPNGPVTPVLKRDPSASVNPPAAVTTININDGAGSGSNTYVQYSGDGSTSDGWPSIDQWVSFVDMWNNNHASISSSCRSLGDNSHEEIGDLWNAIEQIAQASGVDHRFILAEVLQESTGCVRINTTIAPGSGPTIYNPGLMQSFDGYYTCNCQQNDEYHENCGLVNPCPANTITQMIREGTQGTDNGDGLASLINDAQDHGASGAQAFYVAAWWYNQGEGSSDNLGEYASDIANYLTGWLNN